jgi:hypothetical protein
MSTAINRSKHDTTFAASAEYRSTELLQTERRRLDGPEPHVARLDGAEHEVEHVRPVQLLGLGEDEDLAVPLEAVRQLRVHLPGLERQLEELGYVPLHVLDHLVRNSMVDELKETLLAGRAEVCELLFRRRRVEQPAEIDDRERAAGAGGDDHLGAGLLRPDVPCWHLLA